MTKKIIYSDRSFRQEFIDEINRLAPEYTFKTKLEAEDLPQVEISIGWNSMYQQELLAYNHLKWVQAISAGVDYLPLAQFSKKGILVSNASGIHVESISEHVMGIILGYSRGLFQAQRAQIEQTWLGSSVHYQAVENKKLLIIGTGHIGKMLAKKATVFGIECYGINTTGHPVDGFKKTYSIDQLKNVLPTADIVVNILPLTEQTNGLFNQDVFNVFASHALFINVGRGASVKTEDLIKALQQEKLAFAALDVFEEEPLSKESPLWGMENVLVTSHIAGQTSHFQKKLMAIFLNNLKTYVAEKELSMNEIDLSEGY
ncbi:MAG: phosphoglycerate dehydrogenase [Enterococcus sp.]